MPRVVIYTTVRCLYCERAKALLQGKGIPYEEVDLTGADEERVALVKLTKWRTVPQIFIDGRFIGGYEELRALDERGELDAA